MLQRLQFLVLLLMGLTGWFAGPALASHALAGSLIYASLGSNSYRVNVDFFRDCAGNFPPLTFTLNCQTSCSTPAVTAVLNRVGTATMGNPYGSGIQPSGLCLLGPEGSSPAINYMVYHYEATVVLLPNQWTLSVEEASRPTLANSSAVALRLEATLDNRTLTNTSVVFSNQAVLFIPHRQQNLLHIGAFDADGDSLSFALDRPLNGCGTYETYAPYPTAQCQSGVLSTSPPCTLSCALPSTYSARLPIVVQVDTLGTCPNRTTAPRFSFDSLSGAFGCAPSRYLNTLTSIGDNKYAVVMKVTEWRKVNGRYVVVGTTRRDMAWVVYDGTGATLPRLAPTVTVQDGLQTRTQARTVPIRVQAGRAVSVSFAATTAGTTPLAFTLEQNTVPGAVIQAGATTGTSRLTFTPPANLPDGTYHVSLTITDDAMIYRNLITVPVTFRVYRTALALRNASATLVNAYPTPFTERVQFQLPTPGVLALTVHDQLGRVVAHLTSQPDGQVQWTPDASVPPGLYSARSADGKLTVRLLRSSAQ